MKTIFLVEDNASLRSSISSFLISRNINVIPCSDLDSAYLQLEKITPDLMIVDRVLPDGDGLELVEYISNVAFQIKTLILSDKKDVEDRIDGFSSGVDDYLGKPFSSKELNFRVLSLLAKNKIKSESIIELGPIKLFVDDGYVQVDSENIIVRKKELQLLQCLARHQGQVVSRDQIIDCVWGYGNEIPVASTIDVYIRRLRMLLGEYGGMIKTVRGFGYKLTPPVIDNAC